MMSPVVVLDMDGVILRTAGLKVRAMLSLFDAYPLHEAAIRRYVLANTGVPRRQKIVTILGDLVGVEVGEGQVASLLQRYAEALDTGLQAAPLVDGVDAFIRASSWPLYVCSSAPDAEVRVQLRRRGLDTCFVHLYGESTPKPQALRAISLERRDPVVFFGDSVSDLEAARVARTAFVGVVAEADHFGATVLHKLASFMDRPAVLACIHGAVESLAMHGVGGARPT